MPDVVQAIETKYLDPGDLSTGVCVALNFRLCGKARTPSVLILSGCDIENAGDEEQLREQCFGVTELDLSQNKFHTWEEVFKIVKHTPKLCFLNLSFNRFTNNVVNPEYGTLNSLTQLILNGVQLPWEDVYMLLDLAPSIEELHLCKNEYAIVKRHSHPYKSLKKLHFNNNPISDWKEVDKIGKQFPCLEVLLLVDCPMVSLENHDSYTLNFQHLCHLSLNRSHLSTWESVDNINKFPCLTSLRLQHCPLFEKFTDEQRRNFTIARIQHIRMLNGGAISDDERDKAERAFIRYYRNIHEQPGRYEELIEIHGHVNPLADVSLKPQTKVDVKITYGETVFQKYVSVYLKVGDLKKSLESEVGFASSKMRLFYIDNFHGISYAPEELKINTKQLYTLNVHNGDEFIIDFKTIPSSPTKDKQSYGFS